MHEVRTIAIGDPGRLSVCYEVEFTVVAVVSGIYLLWLGTLTRIGEFFINVSIMAKILPELSRVGLVALFKFPVRLV